MLTSTHTSRALVATAAVLTALATAGPASAQTGTPPNCDPSFSQPAPGTGPEWQGGTDPNFNGPAPGTGPEWGTDPYGPEWYSGVPCSNAQPGQGAPQNDPVSRLTRLLFP